GTLRGWLPILQADIESLKETLDQAAKENPFVEIKSGNEVRENGTRQKSSSNYREGVKNAVSSEIEALTMSQKSLYDKLHEQIVAPLFPTEKSKNIARVIIDNINDNGYFDADMTKIAKEIGEDVGTIERVRQRFQYLEPSGIGAIDLLESFLFQLNDFDLDDGVYKCSVRMIEDFENLEKYQNEVHFTASLRVIKKFKNPPALDYQKEQVQIIPDIFINGSGGKIEVKLNEAYYPDIVLDLGGIDEKFDFVKSKIKDATSLIDALDMRKATLTKIALMIVEYQYEFFNGGSIKPMKLDDLAGELERHHSTISRAISNKYLSCDRGVFPIKSFFAVALGEDGEVSNSEIKTFIQLLIKEENHAKPLSDNKILEQVEKKFDIKIGRRTITKYRMQAGIASSSERKKLYTFA
ncbi:MAG: RNA polymerase factor sigma-54, partial [Epsilonproteobacteria bacterium]|nr:RNA polymerase factor sigma-54 [Campylobacterota bacterium]